MRPKEIDEEKLKARYKKQLERQKAYSNKNYDHISIILPAGTKEEIKRVCEKYGYKSPSEYFKRLLINDGVFIPEKESRQEKPPENNPDYFT